MNVYLFPGQGGDARLFGNLKLPETYTIKHITYELPNKGVLSLSDYAQQLLIQVDQSQPFILIGVSLGGMITTELMDLCRPKHAIIISSAKTQWEIPKRLRWLRYFPIHLITPAKLMKWGGFIVQPLVEPDRKHGKQVFIDMLRDLNYTFLKKGIRMIISWDRKIYNKAIVHIHGTKDNTLPYSKVKADFTIDNGSHMMVLTRGKENT